MTICCILSSVDAFPLEKTKMSMNDFFPSLTYHLEIVSIDQVAEHLHKITELQY